MNAPADQLAWRRREERGGITGVSDGRASGSTPGPGARLPQPGAGPPDPRVNGGSGRSMASHEGVGRALHRRRLQQ